MAHRYMTTIVTITITITMYTIATIIPSILLVLQCTASVTTPHTPEHPRSQVQREIIVELKATPRSDNAITEYLLCNVVFGCEGR